MGLTGLAVDGRREDTERVCPVQGAHSDTERESSWWKPSRPCPAQLACRAAPLTRALAPQPRLAGSHLQSPGKAFLPPVFGVTEVGGASKTLLFFGLLFLQLLMLQLK